MGDRLRAVNYLGQLSLAIPPWVGALGTGFGWEGNRRSGVALAMHASQTILVYPPMGSTTRKRDMSTPPTLLLQYGSPLPYLYPLNGSVECKAV